MYKVQPSESIVARNLLSKDDWRLALADEVVECGPQVPLISKPCSFACRAERLTRTGSRPHRTVLRPPGELECETPSSDACEEVALGEACEFAGYNVLDGSLVHNSIWDVSSLDEFAQPGCGFWIVLIVVVHGLRLPPFAS
jgi:hypothetical protein